MCKSFSKNLSISQIMLLKKSGGKSGNWSRNNLMVSNKQKSDDAIFQECIQFHQSGDLNKHKKDLNI